jgi:hypothetical protein
MFGIWICPDASLLHDCSSMQGAHEGVRRESSKRCSRLPGWNSQQTISTIDAAYSCCHVIENWSFVQQTFLILKLRVLLLLLK